MEHQKFSNQSLFSRKFHSLQTFMLGSSSRNASLERYGSKYYRSFLKVNKKSFFSKGHTRSMENHFDMRPKTLVRGLSKVSKKVLKLLHTSKIERDRHCQSWANLREKM